MISSVQPVERPSPLTVTKTANTAPISAISRVGSEERYADDKSGI